MYGRKTGSSPALGILLLLAASPAWAADTDGGDRLGAKVSASKRMQDIQQVPLSIDVTTQPALQAQSLSDTTDLKLLVPGLGFRHGGTPEDSSFIIRGIETNVTDAYAFEQSVGVAIDGVPLARSVGTLSDLVDIQRVETLKGPQTTLFGKSASAGLINIVTNLPELGKDEETFRGAYGSLNTRQYSGTVNLAVSDASAMRVSAWKFKRDGTIHEVNAGEDMGNKNSDGARFKYRLKPTENLDLNFTGEWVAHDENGTGYSIRSFNPSFFTAGNNGQAIETWELANGTVPSATNRSARGLNTPYYDIGRTYGYTAQADYVVGDGTLTAIAAYRDVKNRASFDPFPSDYALYSQQYKNLYRAAYRQTSEEIRYASPVSDRLHYVVGLYDFHLNLRQYQGGGANAAGANSPVVFDADFNEAVTNDSYAAFGDATFDITPQWHLMAGLRHTTDKLAASMTRSSSGLFADVPGDPLGVGAFSTSTGTSHDDWSGRIGMQYGLASDAMTYATASRGYKAPGIGYQMLGTTAASLAASNNGVVRPEIVRAYEVGLKSEWLNRRVMFNLAVFDEYVDDFQVTTGTGEANANQMRTSGVDLTASWLVVPFLNVVADIAYDNARYTDFKNAGCYTGQTAALGCSNNAQDLSGHRLADTPQQTYDLTVRYLRPVASRLGGFLQANAQYRGAVNYSSAGDPLFIQSAYTLVNVSAGLDSADGHWGVSVYANNLFDEHYVDSIQNAGSGNSVLFNDIGYQSLRNIGIALTARF